MASKATILRNLILLFNIAILAYISAQIIIQLFKELTQLVKLTFAQFLFLGMFITEFDKLMIFFCIICTLIISITISNQNK